MTLPDVHLATEAVAAYVDQALASSAHERADRHLKSCPECAGVVEAQREAKVWLAAAPDPALPSSLLARLREIPMTADLSDGPTGADTVLTVADGGELAWARQSQAPAAVVPSSGDGRLLERSRAAAAPAVVDPPVPESRPRRRADSSRPSGRRRSAFDTRRARRSGRGLAGALAGLAFGVVVTSASTGSPGTALPQQEIAPAQERVRVATVSSGGGAGTMDASSLTVRLPERQTERLALTGSISVHGPR